jgi:hypothetical protein
MVNHIAFLTALLLSVCAAYFSIVGLSMIFAAAALQVMIMGALIETAKLVAISWAYRNWDTAPKLIKYYLVTAVAVLMFITSMGAFGYLSRAHADQNIATGQSIEQLQIVDLQIEQLRGSIELNQRALSQLDGAVEQVLERSTSEQGARRAATLRRSQQTERARLIEENKQYQQEIMNLQQDRIPFAAELRKVESEVGPIKYIAKLVYGSEVDQTILEKAVTWVIILIVIVFDPLAIVLLLAANHGLQNQPAPQPVKPTPIKTPRARKKIIQTPQWIEKTSQLIQKRKKGIIEIDKDTVMKMK